MHEFPVELPHHDAIKSGLARVPDTARVNRLRDSRGRTYG
jgi:hypothetical protein